MTNREPKGTPVGGQFAEDHRPDGPDLVISMPRVDGDPTGPVRGVTMSGELVIVNFTDEKQTPRCHECGEAMSVEQSGVSHHLDKDDEIDYDADADHVAFTLEDLEAEERADVTTEMIRNDDYCDYCEVEGHTFRSCPRRDDSPERPGLDDLSVGPYFDGEQMTVREGDVKVVQIARDLGFTFTGLGADAILAYDDNIVSEIGEKALAWLNESRCPNGHYWGFEEGSFGLWRNEDEPDHDVSDDFDISVEYDTSYEDGEYQNFGGDDY